MSSSVFRLSNQKFHLTYKTHLNYDDWLRWAEDKFSKIKEYSIVHEVGDEHHDYPHTHIYVDFEERVLTKKQDIFNYKLDDFNDYWYDSFWEDYRKDKDEKKTGIHPHIKIVKDKEHRDEIVNNYHRKQNTPFTNILSQEELVLREQEEKKANCKKCKKEKYARKHTCGLIEYEEEKPKNQKIGLNELKEKFKENPDFDAISFYAGDDISKITALQKALPYIKKPVGEEPKVLWRPWQMEALEFLSKPSNDRLILWIADLKFRSGKSSFCEHLEMFYKLMFLVDLKLSSVGSQIRRAFEKGGQEIKNIIIDLPKGYEMPKDAYNTLEYLKNGKIISEKYDSAKINFTGSYNRRPNVIVFSNELPDFDKLSADKLGLWLLDDLGVDIEEKSVIDIPDIVLPPGYQKPGTVKEVSKPDEIIEEEGLVFKDFNFKFTEKEKSDSRDFWVAFENNVDRQKLEIEKSKRQKMVQDIRLKKLLSK